MYIQCPEPRPRMRLLAGSRLELAANALFWSKKVRLQHFPVLQKVAVQLLAWFQCLGGGALTFGAVFIISYTST